MFLRNHQKEAQVDEQELAHYINVLSACVALGYVCFMLYVLYGFLG
ncbi:hypothetical protein CKU38_04496 (plasmid) [Xanthomonas citri pv. fuscans]|uniref:Uncharacterized protein n=1 Tax=Xanthomonas campestris pv. phaseoli TaxID=317013 RepID=A0A7Z7J6A2_XANCH|nr:hypothetical protein CKU38_04496 [Xanthomonas citri pv. fuscans]SOO26861.1 conserved hypothetical protein [Xanthomonas phaseoli pv. phaseoli]